MKQSWQQIAHKIDALSLRERVVIFAMVALILIVFINTVFLDPWHARQKQLSQRMKQEQTVIAGLQAEIQQKMLMKSYDPDSENKAKLKQVRQEVEQLHVALRDMQKGLVAPDKMAALLEDILKKNSTLRLVSLKTLPVSSLTESGATEKKLFSDEKKLVERTTARMRDQVETVTSSKPTGQSLAGSIYKHGVEIVVQGNYLDIMNYLAQLETMPWQIFWSKAKFTVDEYPKSTLTLTLFTLSLDKKWLNL